MIPEELFGKIIKYHLLDQEQEADDIRKGLEKKLDAMVNREVYSKFKTAPTEEEWEKFQPDTILLLDSSPFLSLPTYHRPAPQDLLHSEIPYQSISPRE